MQGFWLIFAVSFALIVPPIGFYVLSHKPFSIIQDTLDKRNKDEWSGFADLLANLIEKYAAVMDIDNLPEPPICLDNRVKEYVNNSKHFSESIEKMDIT